MFHYCSEATVRLHCFTNQQSIKSQTNKDKAYSRRNCKPLEISFRYILLLFSFCVVEYLRIIICVDGSPIEDIYKQWLHKGDHTLHAVQYEGLTQRKLDVLSEFIDVEISVSNVMLEVKIDNKQIVNICNQAEKISSKNILKGVTLVAAHPHSGEVMLVSSFKTGEPEAAERLIIILNSIQAGRLLILAGSGDWKTYVSEEVNRSLEEYLGGWWIAEVSYGEMWVGVGSVSGPLWAEGATTLNNYTGMTASKPLRMAVSIPKSFTGLHCKWLNNSAFKERATFCNTYEGYGELCDCDADSIISPENAPLMDMKEEIPIVIATSRHQFSVYRQLHQLWSQAGGRHTPVLLSVDGLQEEGKQFAKVMGIPAVFHKSPASVGTISRISEHIKFSIWHGFQLYPNASKLIILEDDLLLSPDLISYFHQTAPLLQEDNSIFCISAFNYNSFAPTAVDTSKLYREKVIPAFGWMLTREMSHELLPEWPSISTIADWDVYLHQKVQKGRSVITPEVPRTFHNGHGGLHVNGWEQVVHYNPRPLNLDPYARVNISYLSLVSYEAFLERELRTATILEIDEHPCIKKYVPEKKVGSFIIYYSGGTDEEENVGYYIITLCFNGYEQRYAEHHRMMHTIGYFGSALYIIACPGSYYCNIKSEDYERLVYKPTEKDLKITLAFKHRRLENYTTQRIQVRYTTQNLQEEVTMQNNMIQERVMEAPDILEAKKSVIQNTQ